MRNTVLVDLLQARPWVINNKFERSQDDWARLQKTQADDAELDFSLKQGQLMETSKVRLSSASECASMRARLQSIPSTAAFKFTPTMTQA
jgi:phage terminase Nu1 subunit (DNA packaging protein)